MGYPGLKQHAEAAGLTTENKWELVFDFTAGATSNHAQLPPEQWSTQLLEIPDYQGDAEPELYFEYPLRYGGALSNVPPESTRTAGEHSFSIQTSAKEAQAAVDAKQKPAAKMAPRR